MIELSDLLERESATCKWILDLTRLALLGNTSDNRGFAIKVLDDVFSNRLMGSFMGDNQLFLNVKTKTGEGETIYVCDLPRDYNGKPCVVHNYNIR